MAAEKYIIFRLNDQKYGMALSKINGIEKVFNLVPIPMGAEHIRGIMHIRDMIVPIYDLNSKFGMASLVQTDITQVLITETHDIKLGFEVDEVLGIVELADSDIKEVPFVVKNEETGYAENVVKITLPEAKSSDLILTISVDNLMTAVEFDKVKTAIEEAETDE